MRWPSTHHEKPSRDSSFNRLAKFTLTVGAAFWPLLLPINPWTQTEIGLAVGLAFAAAYDRIYAAMFVNRNHQPQTLYEIPWRDGVLVVQPRHQLHINPYRWWRLRLRDEMTDRLYAIHGYFATPALADQYCQNASRAGVGRWIDPADPNPHLRKIAAEAERVMTTHPPSQPERRVPRTPWTIHSAPDDSVQYVAARSVLTVDGPRWEFLPTPPGRFHDTAVLKAHLLTPVSSSLDHRRLDSPLEPMPLATVRAWHRQAAPWQLVPLDPAHDRWVAVQTAPDGSVRAWEPPVPQTRARDDLVTALLPDLAPGTSAIPDTPDPAGWAQRWRQAAWQAAPGGPVWHVPVTHPWVRQHVAPTSASATWHVVPLGAGWGAVQVQPAGEHVSLRLWTLPEQPRVPVTAPDPATCAHRLATVWPHAPIVKDDTAPPWPSDGPRPALPLQTPFPRL